MRPPDREALVRDRLRQIRKAKRRSLEDVAAEVALNINALSRIERGERHLALWEALALCDALGVALCDLLSEEPYGVVVEWI